MDYKNSIVTLCLVVLTGCSTSNQYQVTYNSNPQGATLICSGKDWGYTPVELYYDESVRLERYINASSCSANWVSGVTKKYSTKLNVFPDSQGTTVTLERPKGLGYSQDVEFASKVQRMKAEKKAASIPVRGYAGGADPVGYEPPTQTFTTCYPIEDKISLAQHICINSTGYDF